MEGTRARRFAIMVRMSESHIAPVETTEAPTLSLHPARRSAPVDKLGRKLHDLRISVTDRCNFRCKYCMPKEIFGASYKFLPREMVLSFEEIARMANIFVQLGVRKLRLTGGEPLVRRGVEELVERLTAIRAPDGDPVDIAMTTNGSVLDKKAQALAKAGLKRITVHLDALDDTVFKFMNDVDWPVAKVLAGIEAARAAGMHPIKVNTVIKRSNTVGEILPIVRHFRGTGITPRFIEFMDVGNTNGWSMDEVVPGDEVIAIIQKEFPLVRLNPTAAGETAQRWGFAGSDGQWDKALGEVGVICSVTHPFCSQCNRARLSSDGRVYLCLFATNGYDVRMMMRQGASDEEIKARIESFWGARTDRYSELRSNMTPEIRTKRHKIEMSYIGG
jgi:cyclic pyranopterin phosphate synthase